jgi:transposase-like protein
MKKDKQFRTLIDLIKVFPNEKECHQYLAAQTWSDGVISCPHCGNDGYYVYKDEIRYKCKKCKLVFTAKTKTFMEGSKLPTVKWLFAMYLVLHKKGISSVQLGKDIGVTQKTAWFVLQRIRKAFGNEAKTILSGTVEIDEAFIGGKARFKHKSKRPKYNPGRGWADKTPVFGMLERGGRLKAFVVPNVLMLTLRKASLANIERGSTLYGDGFTGYKGLTTSYNVQCVDHGRGYYVDGDCHTNTLEGAWSQLKRSLIGTYIQVSRKHCNDYVQEFVFRYNYRNLHVQAQMEQIIKNMHVRLKYKELISKAA